MTSPLTEQQPNGIAALSVRPVIEHALTDYGYSPETARALIDQLTAEARAE